MNSTEEDKIPEESGVMGSQFALPATTDSSKTSDEYPVVEIPGSSDIDHETIRLQVFLAHAGLSSRRGAEEMIALGRVRVNGKIIKERGYRVKDNDKVQVDGKAVQPIQKKIYLALNKPIGYVCSNDDPEGRALAKDLIHSYNDIRLFSVGRLDYLSAGLIFFTNDGAFSNLVSHPRSGVEKEYEVEAKKEIPDEFLKEFTNGIFAAGERYRIISYKRLSSPRKVSMVLREGKNREIRNAFAARKITIKSLVRIRIGCVKLGTLAPGAWRTLQSHEIQWFIDQEGTNGSSH